MPNSISDCGPDWNFRETHTRGRSRNTAADSSRSGERQKMVRSAAERRVDGCTTAISRLRIRQRHETRVGGGLASGIMLLPARRTTCSLAPHFRLHKVEWPTLGCPPRQQDLPLSSISSFLEQAHKAARAARRTFYAGTLLLRAVEERGRYVREISLLRSICMPQSN